MVLYITRTEHLVFPVGLVFQTFWQFHQTDFIHQFLILSRIEDSWLSRTILNA